LSNNLAERLRQKLSEKAVILNPPAEPETEEVEIPYAIEIVTTVVENALPLQQRQQPNYCEKCGSKFGLKVCELTGKVVCVLCRWSLPRSPEAGGGIHIYYSFRVWNQYVNRLLYGTGAKKTKQSQEVS